MDTEDGKNLLSDYEFDGMTPWQCKAVDLKWLPSAQIVRLTGRVGDDDYREITLIRASADSRLWLIPIENGMVGYPGTPNDPHNLAAFNDLLRVAQFRVTDESLQETSDLYQFLVGMEVNSNPNPEKMRNSLEVSDTVGQIEHRDGFTDFTHRERFGDAWNPSYMVWEFRYTSSGKFSRLIDVERKTLKEHEEALIGPGK